MTDPQYINQYLFIKVRPSASDEFFPLGHILPIYGDEAAYDFWGRTDPNIWQPFEHGALIDAVAYPELAHLVGTLFGDPPRLPDFRGHPVPGGTQYAEFVIPTPGWSRHTAGERELQRERSIKVKAPPVVWASA